MLKVLPGTSAEAAGLREGDILRALEGKPITSAGELVAGIARRRAGDRLSLDLVRDGTTLSRTALLKEKPRKQGDGFDVLYDSVTSMGHRLRTIISRPSSSGRHPAVLLIQGLGNYSIDTPVGRPAAYDRILDRASRGPDT